jgi:adenylate kinase family enzyme
MSQAKPLISIKPSEHVTFMGTTGSGKTVLARRLLETLDRVIVIDPKHEYRAEGFERAFRMPHFWERSFRLIWRPRRSDDERLADMLYRLFRKKHLTVYVDELTSITDLFPKTTDQLSDMIRTGREPEVTLWSSYQRPVWVPRWFISESRHKFVFTLDDQEDRDRAAKFLGASAKEPVPMHRFLYKAQGLTDAIMLQYNMSSRAISRVMSTIAQEVKP